MSSKTQVCGLKDAAGYLAGLSRFGTRLGLERSMFIMERLGHPERSFRAVHVGGTNGKGSTSALVAGVLQAAGYRTGLYTSPHLVAVTERLKVGCVEIPDSELSLLLREIEPVLDECRRKIEQPTEFEVITALAFLWFARQRVDWAVIEVGLGGRLDATNVIAPEVSVVTPVALDHCDTLGGSLEEVALEKAGIMKRGVPVVVAPQPPKAADTLRRTALERGAPLVETVEHVGDGLLLGEGLSGDEAFPHDALPFGSPPLSARSPNVLPLGEGLSPWDGRCLDAHPEEPLIYPLLPERTTNELGPANLGGRPRPKSSPFPVMEPGTVAFKIVSSTLSGVVFDALALGSPFPSLRTGLLGSHQAQNAAGALGALEVLRRSGVSSITRDAVYRGFREASWPGRLELVRLPGAPDILLDGAHNQAGAETLARALRELFPGRPVNHVVGIMSDKPAREMLQAVLPDSGLVVFTRPRSFRNPPFDPEELVRLAPERAGLEVAVLADPLVALRRAASYGRAEPKSLTCVWGSLYLVGDIKRGLQREKKDTGPSRSSL
ncbi:MAG: bifunctional folylpolyglutamate synthase/dihydrofolate synthase [Firmicutes bacterium]|nr:bifunctional folylpolyglutamate synthase/dihydrofolate synthase [Bacillota bacterium]